MLPGGRVLVREGAEGALAGAARVRDRRVRHARADPQRLADLRRQHREHARGRVLVHDRARARAVRARRARVHARHRASGAGCPRCSSRLAIMSHIVVAIFIGDRGVPALARRGARCARGDRAARRRSSRSRLTAVWLLPLLWQQSVHAEHAVHEAAPEGQLQAVVVAAAARDRSATRSKACGTRSGARRSTLNANPVKHFSPTLWLPWWIWLLAARRDRRRGLVPAALDARAARARARHRRACSSSGPSTRSGTRASCRSGCCRGRSSPRWARPRSRGWSRCAVGGRTGGSATATCRTRAPARGPRSRPPTTTPTSIPRLRKEAAWALAERKLRPRPVGWEPPERALARASIEAAREASIGAIALAVGRRDRGHRSR